MIKIESNCFNVSKISFCNRSCENIKSMDFKAAIIRSLQDNFDLNVTDRYFKNLTPNLLRNISNHPHLMSLQTLGNPYLLFLTRVNGINCCFFVDKKVKSGYTFPRIICVKYRFDDQLYDGTIFWGELVRDNQQRWMFILSDILVHLGIKLKDKNIIYKTELMYKILTNQFKPDPIIDVCPLQVKKLFSYREFDKLTKEFMPNLSYKCRGICFNTLNSGKYSSYLYQIPRHEQVNAKDPSQVMKELNINESQLGHNSSAPNRQKTISNTNFANTMGNNTKNGNINGSSFFKDSTNLKTFKIIKTGTSDIFNLYCLDEDECITKYGISLVSSMKSSKFINGLFDGNDDNFNIIVDCRYSSKFKKWEPVRVSHNENPNSLKEIENYISTC